MWQRKVGDARIANLSHSQVMSDLELIIDDKLTYAALILLGNSRGLGKHLAQSELVYEYRTNDTALQFQQREEYRRGFFLFDEEIWKVINLRNDIQHFQEGLFVWDIRTFNEAVVREAILNAISHRDYRLSGSIFVRQYPRRLEIISPGGFPPGVNAENILGKHVPRNRRVAEVLAKCGLVERSGQGANRMFEECIKESKPRPDYSGTDDYQVALTLRGEVQDPRFLRFLEVVSKEQTALFSTEDLLVLDSVHRDQPLPEMLKDRARTLTRLGILERHGRGGGARYMLSHRLYGFLGKKGEYTRKRGLDKETNKELLYKHIERNKNEGSRLLELREVLPHLSAKSVQHLLGELKSEERVYTVGQTRAARWYPGKKRSIT
jgi:ATP-dependent DNA helicase RecG